MSAKLESWKRTHYCGEVSSPDKGEKVILMGWVRRWRDHGGVIFIDLADRTGIVQLVFNPETNPQVHQKASRLRSEFVIAACGKVRKRPSGTENPNITTGYLEVVVEEMKILNEAKTPPLDIEDKDTGEEARLKYRYLDLRTEKMSYNLHLRHKISKLVRDFLDKKGFWEIETPFLTRSTPEGARDYLVPSRLNPARFYALPQSPQLFKQLLMVGGIDRYFQIVRCFRDEDLRADRQPEFTQIDLELSFIQRDDVLSISEELIQYIFEKGLGEKVKIPFPRMSYEEAMAKYGVDKPDTRFALELKEITSLMKESQLKIFHQVIDKGGIAKGLNVPSGSKSLSLSQRNELIEYVKQFGAKGLAWMEVKKDSLHSPISKYFQPESLEKLRKLMDSSPGDLILIVAEQEAVVNASLGNLRVKLAQQLNLISKEPLYNFCWIVDFPLMEYSLEEKRWVAIHHPFTAPKDEDIVHLDSAPEKVKSKAYDLVLNGCELGGGSIRIHDYKLQQKVFQAIGIDKKEAREKFHFLLEALQYGAPPHGGIAFGLDRILALMSGSPTIRDVIAFPKTQKAFCPTTNAPAAVNEKQLKELHIKLDI